VVSRGEVYGVRQTRIGRALPFANFSDFDFRIFSGTRNGRPSRARPGVALGGTGWREDADVIVTGVAFRRPCKPVAAIKML
jgi:hypothetical protein